MKKISSIKVLMDKTLHHVPKILTKKLIKHKSVKGTKVVQRESLETFNYRRAFYTTTAIIILLSVGIGYGVFAAMNIGMTKEEVKSNLMNQFNNNNDVAAILDRRDLNPLTYVLDKDFDENKVYSFTEAGDSLLEHDVTSSVYHVKDTTPTNVPNNVKRAYSKEDIEVNYIKSVDGVELNGLETGRERDPNTYILKKNFDEQTVYAFSDSGVETQEHDVTSSVYYVNDTTPEFVPNNVKRAYSKQDIENNYVKRLKGNTLIGLETKVEVNPNTYILKSNLKSSQIYTVNGVGTNKEIADSTSSILWHGDKDLNLPQSINTKGYTKKEIEDTYIRPNEVNDLEGLETKSALDPQVYTWDYEFSLDTAYTFSGKIITKDAHIVTDSLYYVADEKPKLVPPGVQRAYTKKNIESNYLLKSDKHNLEGLDIEYERNELSNDHVYSFSGGGVSKAKKPIVITESVHYVGNERPENVPNLVTRAYTAAEVENNYVLKLEKNNIGGINAIKEVDPITYISKNTLESNYYYQSQYSGNDLKVHKLPIKLNDLYIATPNSKDNPTLTLKKFDLNNKQYINADAKEDIYVLDSTDPNLLEFKTVNHQENKAYEVINEGKDTEFSLTSEEVLALDNKIKLFQKEKLETYSDRYENKNWVESTIYGGDVTKQFKHHWKKIYEHGFYYTIFDFIKLANKWLPMGAKITSKEIEYINNNHQKYSFRIWMGHSNPYYKHSYGVLMHYENRTEWRAIKESNYRHNGAWTSDFPQGAKTAANQYKWFLFYTKYSNEFAIETPNKSTAIRGIQIYIDKDYVKYISYSQELCNKLTKICTST